MCPTRHGNQAQSLAEAIIPAGGRTLLHRHLTSEEIYYIVRGDGMMTLDGKAFFVKAGDTICIPPGTPRHQGWHPGAPPHPVRLLAGLLHDDTELLEAEPVVVPQAPKGCRPRSGGQATCREARQEAHRTRSSEWRQLQGRADSLDMGQGVFWKRVFVTQSGGSRYENGRNIPEAVKTLLKLVPSPADSETFLARLRAPYQGLPRSRPGCTRMPARAPISRPCAGP
jgi:hypothetical protein